MDLLNLVFFSGGFISGIIFVFGIALKKSRDAIKCYEHSSADVIWSIKNHARN